MTTPDSRPGPYETAYEVLRGYDSPPPAVATPPASEPALFRGREPRHPSPRAR